jgi:SEC-C motif
LRYLAWTAVTAVHAGTADRGRAVTGFDRAADAERDRNELCTCGSGRKWKRCHGMERPLELVG